MEDWYMIIQIQCGYRMKSKMHNQTAYQASKNKNRIDILDWTLEIKEVSLILNLDTKDISYMEQNYHVISTKENVYQHPLQKQQSLGTPKHIANYSNLLGLMHIWVKYQERYWIETNAEWSSIQKPDVHKKVKYNDTSSIATRFEIYP